MSGYYEKRTHCQYYKLVKEWLESYGEQSSILDIGPADTPVVGWGSFFYRYTIDPKLQSFVPHVTHVRDKWPQGSIYLPKKISVITCLQVLEHIQDVQPFVDAVFSVATYRVIISIPYKWPHKSDSSHVHDPISKEKIRSWTK
jgi:hypothetical protein